MDTGSELECVRLTLCSLLWMDGDKLDAWRVGRAILIDRVVYFDRLRCQVCGFAWIVSCMKNSDDWFSTRYIVLTLERGTEPMLTPFDG